MDSAIDSPHRTAARPRLLVVAYGCSPLRGSEAGVGWNRALEAAKFADTWVVCEGSEFGAEVRRYLAECGPIPGLNFEFVPQLRWESKLWNVPGMGYLAYNLWHRRALKAARRLHTETPFDLVHQLTFATYREPGYSMKLGVPWIWGPFGGTQNFPWRFAIRAGLLGGAREIGRNLFNAIQLRCSGRIRRAARTAAVVVAANSEVQNDFRRTFGVEPIVESDVGIPAIAPPAPPRAEGGRLRILWAGLLITRKALNLLVEALARLPSDVDCEVRVVGDGPLRARWQRLARQRGVDGKITWCGRISHADTWREYAAADVFVFSSLRDTTGCVIVEALSSGLPVVCLDHQGAHDVVTDECGVRIPVTEPSEVIDNLAAALTMLARDPGKRRRLGEAARRLAENYLWSRQGERMAAVYRRALAGGGSGSSATGKMTHGNQGGPSLRVRCLRRVSLAAFRPLDAMFPRTDVPGFSILMYHRVTDNVKNAPPPTWNVQPYRFRAQLQGLLERGYRAWPLRRVIEAWRAGTPIPPKTFVVTFDDGFENLYTSAWPILRNLNVPATILLATAAVDSTTPFAYDTWSAAGSPEVPVESWRMLTTAQCCEMLAGGLVDLGTQTHTHADFRHRPAALADDLRQSLDFLHERFGIEEAAFAFPFGYFDDELLEATERCGVHCAMTTVNERVLPESDPLRWGRTEVHDFDTAATIASKMDGWYRVVQDRWHAYRRRVRETGKAVVS